MTETDGATANWPFGLFLSEHTFAIIVLGAIPRHSNSVYSQVNFNLSTTRIYYFFLVFFDMLPFCSPCEASVHEIQ